MYASSKHAYITHLLVLIINIHNLVHELLVNLLPTDKLQVIFRIFKFIIIDTSFCLKMYSIITAMSMNLHKLASCYSVIREEKSASLS